MSEESKKKVTKITRKKKTEEPNEAPAYAEENSGILGYMNNYSGQFISLNMKNASYFGVGLNDNGRNKVWLSSTNWCDTVPDDISDDEVALISRAIASGRIVLGKKWIPALDKDKKTKPKYVALLRKYKVCNEDFKGHIRKLVLKKKEGNYTPTEIVRAMLASEKDGRNRPDFLSFLNDAHGHCDGPVSLVEDFPSDPENYEVIIDQTTGKVVSTTKKERDIPEGSPFASTSSDDPKERAEKIENAFG